MAHFGAVRHRSGLLQEGLEAPQLAQALREEGAVGWLDLEAAPPEELAALEVMPWVKQPWGVVAATLLMIGLSAGAFMFFKRRDWL